MFLSHHKRFILVFFSALIVRGIVFVFVAAEPQVVFQPDSGMYVSLGKGILHQKSFSYVENPEKLDAERTPGYPFFLASVFLLFSENPLTIVVIQIFLDILTCLLIYHLGEHLWKGSGLLSGLLAALNLGMVTYAHFILSDTLFLFLFVCVLLFLIRAMQGWQAKEVVLLGLFLGLATLVRPVSTYLPFLISLFLIIYFRFKSKLPIGIAFKKAIGVIIIYILILSPWLIRNYIHFDRFRLSSQEGGHFLQYIVPFSWQYSKGISFIEGMKKTSESFNAKTKEEGLNLVKANPFDVSDLSFKMAWDYLRQEPLSAIVKSWLFGMIKNLFAPAMVDFSYLLHIERPHFFYTEGKSVLDRCWNFIKGMRGFFSWLLLGSLLWMVIIRIFQLWGLYKLFREKPWESRFIVLIIGYFLLISGPVGYAKYRLPFEPFLIVLAAIGMSDLYARWLKKADQNQTQH